MYPGFSRDRSLIFSSNKGIIPDAFKSLLRAAEFIVFLEKMELFKMREARRKWERFRFTGGKLLEASPARAEPPRGWELGPHSRNIIFVCFGKTDPKSRSD